MKLILASNSPRRKELLSLAKFQFEVITQDVEESLDKRLPVAKQIEQIAYKKANAVAINNDNDVVIGADTVVVVDEEILGKPKDEQDALRMIKMLSGKTHQVITAVAIIYQNEVTLFHEITDVTFYEMTEEDINQYVKLPSIYDKAGAYAIQGEAALYIKAINGDYYNVMGLPIAKVTKVLKERFNF